MTSISTATQVYTPQPTAHAHSGKGRMASAIQQQEASGALSSTDATALTNALSSIDSSLSSDTSSANSVTSGTSGSSSSDRLDPSSAKDRIDSLISDQVSSGTLTSDQATELKNLFASPGKSVSGTDSGSNSDGPDGPPPGPPPAIGASGSPSDSTSSPPGSTSGSSSSDLLSTFIQQLQAAQSNGMGYASSGLTSSSQSSALLFDFNS